jgi:hypothetical protein
MSPTFSSLSIRNYRIYAAGTLVSNIGTWMQRVARRTGWCLANAVGLNSASFNSGRVIGPAVAGVMIAALGSGRAP